MVRRFRKSEVHDGDEASSLVGASFADILGRAKAGDDAAAGILYDNHVAMVSGYLRARGVYAPEDVTSEVFLGMLRNIDRFDGNHADFRRWLMTISHRRLIDHRRRQHASQVELVDPAELAAPATTPAVDVDAVILDQHIVRAFELLTDAQQEVVALRFIADLSLEDVAAITERPVGAVKSLQHRALASLRQNLARDLALDRGA